MRTVTFIAALSLAGCALEPPDHTSSLGFTNPNAKPDEADTAGGEPEPDERVDPREPIVLLSAGGKPAFETVDLGPVSFGGDGLGTPVAFQVPDDTVSVTVMLVGHGGSVYALDSLGPLEGDPLVTPGWSTRSSSGICTTCPARTTGNEEVSALTVPNAPGVTITPGPWSARWLGVAWDGWSPAGKGTARAIFKTKATPKGLLDVHLHVTGAGDLRAADALGDTFSGLVQILGTKLASGGVTLGTVTIDDVDPSYRFIETLSGPGNDLSRMFEETEGLSETGVHVFLVDTLWESGLDTGGGFIAGIAAGIPGAVGVAGTGRSGVAVVVNPDMTLGMIGIVCAHEIGHFLGLYHSTESNGAGDGLADTKTGDTGNLMHWSAVEGQQKLTPSQGQVIRWSPLVRSP